MIKASFFFFAHIIKMTSAFMYGLTRVQGVSSNTFMQPASGSPDALPNSIATFSLPASAIIDTKRVLLHFDAKTTGSGGRLPPAQYLISRVTVSSGGVQITSGHSFHNVMLAAKAALMKNKIDSVVGHPHSASVRAKAIPIFYSNRH